MSPKLAYTLKEAAEATPFSVSTLRKAVTQNYRPNERKFPRLNAKAGVAKGNSAAFVILHEDLQAWLEQLPDA
ncbi:hypothetical protein [Arcanobacterium phocae]|uniref:hypothetical protein n=1 Tax=Arcanobacterium phocae TaxID=131112 RepID=UPI001C0F3870|nr:hypothetical protein [Arcanobacterium phocae]